MLHRNTLKATTRTVIDWPNTDVFRIEIAASNQIDANLFIRTGKENKARIFSILNVKEIVYTQLFLYELLGLYVFTGWNHGQYLSGKGKVNLLKLMMKN